MEANARQNHTRLPSVDFAGLSSLLADWRPIHHSQEGLGLGLGWRYVFNKYSILYVVCMLSVGVLVLPARLYCGFSL